MRKFTGSQTELREKAATLRRIANDIDAEADQIRDRPSWAYDSIFNQARDLYSRGMTDLVAVVNKRHQANLVSETREYMNWNMNDLGVLESIATDFGDVKVFYTREDLVSPIVYGRKTP